MNAAQQLKEIKRILNAALAPTIRIVKDTEYPMSEGERVQWLANKLQEAENKLRNIANDVSK